MCGIVGYLEKRSDTTRPLGATLLEMLQALGCRGPDSAGVAIYGPERTHWTVNIKLPEEKDLDQAGQHVLSTASDSGQILRHQVTGAYLHLTLATVVEPGILEAELLARCPGIEVVSLGHRLEILKQVGSPAELDQAYGIAARDGSHGIGHTRLSTESRVDLSHSQPFWAHGVPDLATVHNGHITNYHKLRRCYEQQGYRFFTENDSEVIGIYLRDRMRTGLSFEDSLRSSLDDFDGSFSYLAANADSLAYVRDQFGFKPLVVAETDNFVALATEEIALRRALGRDFSAREPVPGSMSVWKLTPLALTH